MNDVIYCNEELDINGTAGELYREVRNGYRTKIDEIDKISEILAGEGKDLESLYCQFEIENINSNTKPGAEISSLKQDYITDIMVNPDRMYPRFFKTDIDLGDDIIGTFEENPEGDIFFSIENTENDTHASNRITKDEFLALTQDSFEKMINEMNFYAIPAERDL